MSREYDTSLDYRVVCALRNSAQHNGSPVHGYMLGSSRSDDNEFVESAFEPHIMVAELARDARFKKSILKEIEDGPPRIDIKPLIRRFLESIFRIHREFRKLTESPVANAIGDISSAKVRASQQYPDFPAALWAVATLNDNGELQGDQVNLTDTLLEYATALRRNFTPHDDFSKRRVAF